MTRSRTFFLSARMAVVLGAFGFITAVAIADTAADAEDLSVQPLQNQGQLVPPPPPAPPPVLVPGPPAPPSPTVPLQNTFNPQSGAPTPQPEPVNPQPEAPSPQPPPANPQVPDVPGTPPVPPPSSTPPPTPAPAATPPPAEQAPPPAPEGEQPPPEEQDLAVKPLEEERALKPEDDPPPAEDRATPTPPAQGPTDAPSNEAPSSAPVDSGVAPAEPTPPPPDPASDLADVIQRGGMPAEAWADGTSETAAALGRTLRNSKSPDQKSAAGGDLRRVGGLGKAARPLGPIGAALSWADDYDQGLQDGRSDGDASLHASARTGGGLLAGAATGVVCSPLVAMSAGAALPLCVLAALGANAAGAEIGGAVYDGVARLFGRDER